MTGDLPVLLEQLDALLGQEPERPGVGPLAATLVASAAHVVERSSRGRTWPGAEAVAAEAHDLRTRAMELALDNVGVLARARSALDRSRPESPAERRPEPAEVVQIPEGTPPERAPRHEPADVVPLHALTAPDPAAPIPPPPPKGERRSLGETLVESATVPLAIADVACDTAQLAALVARHSAEDVRPDAAGAAVLAAAAALVAAHLVEVNLVVSSSPDWVGEARDAAQAAAASATAALTEDR